jgi:hypothetical protein
MHHEARLLAAPKKLWHCCNRETVHGNYAALSHPCERDVTSNYGTLVQSVCNALCPSLLAPPFPLNETAVSKGSDSIGTLQPTCTHKTGKAHLPTWPTESRKIHVMLQMRQCVPKRPQFTTKHRVQDGPQPCSGVPAEPSALFLKRTIQCSQCCRVSTGEHLVSTGEHLASTAAASGKRGSTCLHSATRQGHSQHAPCIP